MRVTLLGTGDTTGTPTVGCDCDTCREARERGIERTRFSVHVENERTGESLLIDASPDFRYQFLRNGVPLPDAAVITHVHFDHLDGLGNVFRVFDSLDVYAADETDPETGKSVARTVADDYHYLDALVVHPTTPFETVRICGFDVTLVPVDHPPLVCYGLAIEERAERRSADSSSGERREESAEPRSAENPSGERRESPETTAKLSITGDTSYAVPEESRELLSDPDLLLADGIVPASLCEHHPLGGRHEGPDGVPRTFGTKHMTREGALALADELDASETRLVHVAHFYPVEEAFEDPLAIDGEEYTL